MIKEILKDVIPIIQQYAPIIANALGSPAATYALSLLASAFNIKPENISQLPAAIQANVDHHSILCTLESTFGDLFTAGNIKHMLPKKLEMTIKLDWTG